MQNVCKMYANSMQKICKNDAKSIQNLCKKDTVMHSTLIYTWNMPDMVKYRAALWHFRQLAFGNWHFWHLPLATFGTFGTFG